MPNINVVAIDHKFGERSSDLTGYVAVNCENCNRQCGFTGLFVRDAVISEDRKLIGGDASTTVIESATLDDLRNKSSDELNRLSLNLGRIEGSVELDGLTDFTMDQVERILTGGGCLVELAKRQATEGPL